MTSSFAEWVVRTFMLVLAGLVTLSILGSIAAMSTDAGTAPLFDRAAAPAPAPPAAEAEAPPVEEPPPAPDAAPAAEAAAIGTNEVVAAAAPSPPADREAERWLEAIAYALLAIAGLLALLLIVAWRAVRALSRIADATALGQQRN